MPDPPSPEDKAQAPPKPPPRPAPRKKVLEMPSEPWDEPLAAAVRERFGEGVERAVVLGGQKLLVASMAVAADLLAFLRDEQAFDYLVDITAVHWPDKEQPFEVVWILYSFQSNERVRVKAALDEGAEAPSAVALYSAADWLEREVYDMFGIQFAGHPGLTRILMPDEWEGFPLRKDYGIVQQDADWVRENLKIESAQ